MCDLVNADTEINEEDELCIKSILCMYFMYFKYETADENNENIATLK